MIQHIVRTCHPCHARRYIPPLARLRAHVDELLDAGRVDETESVHSSDLLSYEVRLRLCASQYH